MTRSKKPNVTFEKSESKLKRYAQKYMATDYEEFSPLKFDELWDKLVDETAGGEETLEIQVGQFLMDIIFTSAADEDEENESEDDESQCSDKENGHEKNAKKRKIELL
jgi:hypothetical protein